MDHWLKTGSVSKSKRKTTESNDPIHTQEVPSSITNISTENLKKKYSEEYFCHGFSFIAIDNVAKPECVICGEILANSSMKPSQLTRHLITKHSDLKDKDVTFFKRLLENKNKCNMQTYLSSGNANVDAVEASFRISYNIARSGKNHTIGENLILPSIKDAVHCMFGEKYVNKINAIPLSNDTVSRRIKDISYDIEETILKDINNSELFSIQVDESTDVAQLAVLLVIARYIKQNESEEGLLLCHPLTGRTTGADIFHAIDSYFAEKKIKWSQCCGLSTDGGKSMSGCYSGLLARVKAVSPLIKWTHCCIHRQALASKPLPADLKDVLDDSCKVVNFIKSRHTNSRIFSLLCEDMGSLHKTLLLHTEVRWLSRGKVLTRLFELRHEVQMFFEDHPFRLSSKFNDHEWLQKLAYLSDVFLKLNNLNLTLQNSAVTIFQVNDKIESFVKKLEFWKTCIENNQPEIFEALHDFLSETDMNLSQGIKHQIVQHLNELKTAFAKYFPKCGKEDHWIMFPFSEIYFKSAVLSAREKEKLIELKTDSSLQVAFLEKKSLITFWANVKDEYPELSYKAFNVLLPFTSSVLVERAFSSYTFIKNRYRNRLSVSSDLRVFLSSVEPDFKKLSANKQAQGSH
ncbi:zinc finger BED domain-containing protein 5-like [Metopolophium dirhodum]|uniref:zinc finger BED domain-containing protein 5-like n=1 Tax=Metopolophium dirhodum TaxID=44670 RepID=UPI00298F9C2C|nr:zinc finger BED domain-containing protein 5-like [Metopolophium dirhodum]